MNEGKVGAPFEYSHSYIHFKTFFRLAQRCAMYKFIAWLPLYIGYGSVNICMYNLFRTLHQEIQCYKTQYYYTRGESLEQKDVRFFGV
jgi:hypothetical protein